MLRSYLVLLILSLGLLTTGHPYGGVKGSRWRIQQEKTYVEPQDHQKEPEYGLGGEVGGEFGGEVGGEEVPSVPIYGGDKTLDGTNEVETQPDNYTPLEGEGSEYVPENTLPHKKPDTSYVPDQGIEELEEEISNSYGPNYEGSPKDSVQEYIPQKEESYGKDSDHIKSESEVPWYEKLKRKWNEFGESAQEGVDSVGRAIHTTVQNIKGNFNALWNKFEKVLSNFGYEIQRGARYVFTVISTSVEEVKASELIEKLEQRLEQGNEIVDEFFQKVGQKMTHWAQQHNHENIDEGLFLEAQQSKENNFLDIFQDKEIHDQVNKMVTGGVITQEEADLFSQIKQTKGEKILDSSYPSPDYQVDPHSSSNIEGNIDQLGASGASYGTEGHVDHSAYDNQDAKPHHTTKKELEGHTVEDKGYGRHDLKTINFPIKG